MISLFRKLGQVSGRFGLRLFLTASTSLLHLILIYSIKLAEDAGGLQFPMAPMYLIFLYFDIAFQATNDFRRRGTLSYNVVSVFFVLLPAIPMYAFLSSWEYVIRYPVAISGLIVAVGIARSFHSISALLFLYDKSFRAIAITQGLVLILQLALFALCLAGFISSQWQLILQFLSFGIPFLFIRPSMKFVIRFNEDFITVARVVVDFVRHQFVFIQFSNVISAFELANIMFVRSVLGPLVMVIASRRKALGDAVINGEIQNPKFLYSSLPIYGLALLMPLPLGLFGFDYDVAFAWTLTLIAQDYRANIIRLGLYTNELPPTSSALTSIISLALVILIFAFIEGFSIYLIVLPSIIDILNLKVFHAAAGVKKSSR